MGFIEDFKKILNDLDGSVNKELKEKVKKRMDEDQKKSTSDFVVPYMNVQNVGGVLKDVNGNDLSVNKLNGKTLDEIINLASEIGSKIRPAKNAEEIKQIYPNAQDGFYYFQNDNVNNGKLFQAYCDMTTDGGGWMLVLVVNANDMSSLNTPQKVGLCNPDKPGFNISHSYSILSWADFFKKSSKGWQWMIEANNNIKTRHTWGGIFTANEEYKIFSKNMNQTNITTNKFWNVSGFNNDYGIGKRVPWLGGYKYPNTSLYTTDDTDSSWWGNIVEKDGKHYKTGPWISGDYGTSSATPLYKRLWIR